MMKKYISIAFAALAIVSCGNKEKQAAEATADETPKVKLATVRCEDIAQTEVFTATVESDIKNNIAPNAPFRIEKIFVEVGDPVKKGQLLVQLDASSLRQLKIQMENTMLEFSRTEQLYKVGGASKAEYDNAKAQLDVLRTQYHQMTQNTELRSPISGVVTARNYDNGDMYGGLPILTVEQTNPVKLKFNVSETHYKNLKKGQNVDITLDAYEGETFKGKVTIVNPSIDAATHTFLVEVTIDNASQKVRPGMFARATVSFGTLNHVVIPDAALVKQIGAGDRYVYVYHPDKKTVSYNKVQLGKHMGNTYEIFSGCNAGDRVVIAGQARLANGKAVEVVE